MSAAARRPPTIAGRLGRAIGIVLVFAVAGPPIGGLLFAALVHVATILGVLDHLRPELMIWSDRLFIGIVFGFLDGTGPLALAGLAIGIKQAFFGPTSWWMGLGAGLMASVVLVEGFGDDFGSNDNFRAIVILACVGSSMLCWSMVRGWYCASGLAEAAP